MLKLQNQNVKHFVSFAE